MIVAIQYSRPSSGTGEGEIFGLDVAVNNFLTAYFKYSQQQQFICRPTDIPSFEHFKALAQAAGVDAEAHCLGIDPRHPKHNLSSIDCLFRPDPLISDLIWRRQQLSSPGFATCGLVHTMSGERIARAVGELCVAPGNGADALICPSEAVRDAVHNLWDIYSEYLSYHFKAPAYKCPLQTPVIPLGIDTGKFQRLTTADKRTAQRNALNIAEDEVVILFVGRLSFATKAHPLALWQAAERAAERSTKKIRLLMYGYFKPKDMEQHFRKLADETRKKASIEFVMNDDGRFPDGLWAAGDIFASLSDNIQESFGLTPVEAMACGLPSVITDWNGYRGSLRDGIDGFLIRTMTPPPQAGMAIAEAYYNEENYGISLTGSSQSTFIDIEQCAQAFQTLAEDSARRRSMGDHARERARDVFDWKHIIKAYEDLWFGLGQKRNSLATKPGVPKNWQAVHPAFPNPWRMFRSFPSAILQPANIVQIAMSAGECAAVMNHEMNFFLPELLAPKETMLELINVIRRAGSASVQNIVGAFPVDQQDRIYRCIGWMLKHGICVVT